LFFLLNFRAKFAKIHGNKCSFVLARMYKIKIKYTNNSNKSKPNGMKTFIITVDLMTNSDKSNVFDKWM
jgi:hypothetical protein